MYVLPDSLEVVDTPAEIRIVVTQLKAGERVEVEERTRNWARVRVTGGVRGWAELRGLIDAPAYEAGQRLLDELGGATPQARGRTTAVASLRVEPGRVTTPLAQLAANVPVEIFARRLVERDVPCAAPGGGRAAPASAPPPPAAPVREAWYQVRAASRAGWILGRMVRLEVPEEISMYAREVNLVAWQVLNTVEDGKRQVPQYLVADRVGTQEFDFNRIRVLTWWAKRQEYATAYVESSVSGFFPIRATSIDGVPHFRLRLEDRRGHKFQKVYRMVDTIVRPVGAVEGWESSAMPTEPKPRARRQQAP